jgi:hypothetical protein
MSPDAAVAAVAAVPRPISQVIEIACAALGRGGCCGGLRRFPKQQQNQRAAVLRRLRRGAPHTPMRSATHGAFRGRMSRRAVAGTNPKGMRASPMRCRSDDGKVIRSSWRVTSPTELAGLRQ